MILLPSALGEGEADAEEALARAAWVARIHERDLRAAGHEALRIAATRGLRDELERTSSGLALYAHGNQPPMVPPDRVDGEAQDRLRRDPTAYLRPSIQHRAGEPILDLDNLDRLKGRWVYAFACRAGVELAGQAVQQGCPLFVGYQVALQLDWSLDDLPPEILAAFERFLSATLLELADGRTDRERIGRRLYELAEPVEQWLIAHPEVGQGVMVLMAQLKGRLVIRAPVSDPQEP